ncbi:MAG: hypothetical protein KDD47_12525, partial [Acidobacteria bacterium]|nr:hypothetical protein [Acidobacteriota bacterium]
MTRNSCPMFCRPGVGRLPFLGITAIWLTVACALALPLQTGAQERPTLGSPDSLTVRSVELRQVSFEKPARVGFGEEARYYDRAVEIRLVVDPFFEGDLEPALWVGDEEIRGHRILRRPDHFVLAFDAFEPQKLEAGACIWVGTTRPSRETCAFTYEPSRIVDGQPLVEEPLATSGKPDPRQWDRDDQDGGQCAAKLPPIGPADYYGYELALYDPQDHRIEQLQPGDSLAVEISNIPPLRQVQLRVIDDQGQEWAYAR